VILLLLLLLLGLARAGDDVVAELKAIEAAPGTTTWDRAVAFHLLLAYDHNHSGRIDTRRELDEIPCETWAWIDRTLAQRSQYPGIVATYGFPDDLEWLGGSLGLHQKLRHRASSRLAACGLTPEGPGGDIEVDPQVNDMVTGMMLGLPEPGSPLWVTRARIVLLLTYDADSSGLIDTGPELRSVSCSVWRALDAALLGAQEDGLVEAFGLRADLPWAGVQLGVTEALAPDAYETARRCGLHDAGQ